MKRTITGLTVLFFLLVVLITPIKAEPEVGVIRLSGVNRYDTAVKIAQAGWETSDIVILARGDDYADSLVGVGLAGVINAPILLSNSHRLSAATSAEIDRLGATAVIILGGAAAISDSVADELCVKGLNVERLFGGNRYETAAAISQRVLDITGIPAALVVSGVDFPDALAMAPTSMGCSILLTKKDVVPQATLDFIQANEIENTWVFGGEGVISEEVYEALPFCERLGGNNRYATAVEIAKLVGLYGGRLYIASGTSFPDALALGALASRDTVPILLVSKDRVPAVLAEFLESWVDQYGSFQQIYVAGGEAAVSGEVLNELWRYGPTK